MIARPTWFSASYYVYNKLDQAKEIPAYADWSHAQMQDAIMAFSKDGTLDDGAWNHYQEFGSAEGLELRDEKGNVVIDPKVYCESKLAQLKAIGFVNSDTMTWEEVLTIITNAGMTVYSHYMQHGAGEGLSINKDFNTGKYFAAKLEYVKTHTAQFPELAHLTTVAALAEYYALYGVDAYQNWLDYGESEGISAEMVKPGSGGEDPGTVTGESFYLKPLGWWGSMATGDLGYHYADQIDGTDGNDTFIAYIYGDQNSLNTGDQLDGKGGTDTLLADITGLRNLETGGYNSALTPHLKNVEILKFRVQETGGQTGDNNVMARIDAERIEGARQFWSSNSRDDLLIEDVRINSNVVTVGMQNTDPGDVDYKFYFDPQHLKADDATTSGTLILKLIDTEGALTGNPLMDNPYNKIYVHFDGVLLEIEFAKVSGTGDMDTMYEKLRAEIQTAVTAKGLDFTVTLGNTFSMVDSNSGKTVVGREILMSGEGTFTVDKAAGDGWGTVGAMPPETSVAAIMQPQGSTDCPLIKTNVALDNVGRVQWDDAVEACLPDNSIYGSNAGDMVVGSMATRGGIERFDVTVDRGSWLNSLSSTNNTLRMITVAAKDWDGDGWANSKEDPNAGQLFIGAHATASLDGVTLSDQTQSKNVVNWQDATRVLAHSWSFTPTTGTPVTGDAGIKDVKYFEASDYAGDISIAAEFTADAYAKYLKDVDGLRTVYSSYAPGGDFLYNFGSGDDTLNMKVDGSLLADRDFILNMSMGAGNDYVNYVANFKTGNQAVNQTALRNVTISTGAGNDTVWAWGKANATGTALVGNEFKMNDLSNVHVKDQIGNPYDGASGYLKVDAGSGDDTVYAAQAAGEKNAVWVVNANTLADSAGDPLRIEFDPQGKAQPLDNNVASTDNHLVGKVLHTTATTYELHGRIHFLGIEVDFTVATKNIDAGKSSYSVSADEINKAIIKAIETDPQLSKLLAAFDGAGRSLLIQSLIDGHFVEGNGYFTSAGEFVVTDGDLCIGFYDVTTTGSSEVYSYNIIGDIVDQAHYAGGVNSGLANRVVTVNMNLGAGFIANEYGAVYALTIDGNEIAYTQKATDDDWTDIINGLNAVAGGYTITTTLNPTTGLATTDGEVIITRDAREYVEYVIVTPGTPPTYGYVNYAGTDPIVTYAVKHVTGLEGTLKFDVPANWTGSAPAANTEYVLTLPDLGGAIVDLVGTGATWNDVVAALKADAVTRGIAVAADITITRSTSGVVTVEIKNTPSNYLPDVASNIRTEGASATASYGATVTFDGFDAANTDTYTVVIDPDGAGTTYTPITLSYTQVTGENWNDIVAGLQGTAGHTALMLAEYKIEAGANDGELIVSSTVNTLTSSDAVVTSAERVTDAASATDYTGGGLGQGGVYTYADVNTGLAAVTGVPTVYALTITVGGAVIPLASYTDTTGAATWAIVLAGLTASVAPGSGYTITAATPPATGHVSIVTPNLAEAPVISFTTAAGGSTTTYTVTPGTPVQTDTVQNVLTFDYDPAGSFGTYAFNLAGTDFTYTDANTTPDTWAEIVTGLLASATMPAGYTAAAGTNNGELIITATAPVTVTGTPPTALPVTNTTYTIDTLAGAAEIKVAPITVDRVITVDGWTFTSGQAGAGNEYEIAIDIDGPGGTPPRTYTYKQLAGDKWADVVAGLANSNTMFTDYSFKAGADGQLIITVTHFDPATMDPEINLSGSDDAVLLVSTTIAGNFTDMVSTAGTTLQVSGWTFVPGAAGVGDVYTITIDPDGAGSLAAVELSYTQKAGDTWLDVVANLNSKINYEPGLAGNVVLTAGTAGILNVNKVGALTTDPVVVSVGGSNTGVDPATDDYANYTQTGWAQDGATGADKHYYGGTEVYGGDGNDVIVTGYADANVYAGAGDDTIVAGNWTYNNIWGGTGADTITLGSRDANTNNGNNVAGKSAYDVVHQAKGDSGVIAAANIIEVSSGQDYVVTGTFDVIHHFDRGPAAATATAPQSDRLYLDDYVTTGTASNLTNAELRSASQLSSLADLKNAVTTGSASYDNKVLWVNGVYDDANHKFTVGTTGYNNDMLLVYDADPTKSDTSSSAQTWEAVILTGVGGGTVITHDTNTLNSIDFITIA